jgi:hypothetical protein
MKNLLIALVVLSSLVSCGKNSVGAPISATSPLTVTGVTETMLGTMIDNNQFGTGTMYVNGYQENFQQLITNMPNIKYNYSSIAASTNANSNSNCLGTIGGVCFLGYSTSWSGSNVAPVAASRVVVNSSVDLQTKKNALKAIINLRIGVQQNGTAYIITTTDMKRYIIDTALPIQANPAETRDAQGNGEYYSGYQF